MRKRKLLTKITLEALRRDTLRGVPLARAMRNQRLTMSRPSVRKLCVLFETGKADDSMLPDWLVTDEQEQPDNMCYLGEWPEGEWVWTQ